MIERLSHAEKSMFLFLSADAIMTFAFFFVFGYLRLTSPQWPTAFHFASGLMSAAMTMFLLAGSFTITVAVRQNQARWLAVTIACWGCFVLLEGMEWLRLIAFVGVSLRSNPWNVPSFGAIYFFLTGLHGLHVVGGMIFMVLVALRRWDFKAARWYVHFVNAMWLPIFFGLYLASTDLQGLT